MVIRPTTIAEIHAAGLLPELLEAYAAESSIPELGQV